MNTAKQHIEKNKPSGSIPKRASGNFFNFGNGETFFQPKLYIGQVNDPYEREADAVADQVMRMKDGKEKEILQPKSSSLSVQRLCPECKEEEEETLQRKENSPEHNSRVAPPIVDSALRSGGKPLDHPTRFFMESRFGYDFSNVKVHTGTMAAKSAQSINALAYTSGNHIVFKEGQYSPETKRGRRLLAHELTHVVQQKTNTIQRTVHRGQDYAGKYEFDDNACTLDYSQDWYFSFPSGMGIPARNTYMTAAENQVESVWSHKHSLNPSSGGCPCQDPGVDVTVNLNTFNRRRGNKHGYDVVVTTDPTTGFTNQPARDVTISDTHDIPVNMGSGLTQQRIAHEFGHTLGITDEYHWWASLWNTFGHNDRSSIMHSGDEVRPRHYQHFADLISNIIEGCSFRPAGFSSRALANPTARLGITGALSFDNADFILDLHIDRRFGNTDLLGLVTPRIGFSGLLNASNGNVMFGPTFSLSLNRIAHPIYVDLGTGVLYDPEDPGRPAGLNIPVSATLGLRGNGFSAGINYTGLIDTLGNNGYTHMIGLNLQFDLTNSD